MFYYYTILSVLSRFVITSMRSQQFVLLNRLLGVLLMLLFCGYSMVQWVGLQYDGYMMFPGQPNLISTLY